MNELLSEDILNSFRRKAKRHQVVQTDEQMIMLDLMESDLNKVRLENLKLQNQLKQAQDNLSIHANNYNNTSSKFMLPSEFKAKFEQMVKESLPSAFATIFDRPKLLVQVVQSTCLLLHQKIKQALEEKTLSIARLLGSTDTKGLQNSLLKLYQDNFTTILPLEQDVITLAAEHTRTFTQELCEEDLVDWFRQYWMILSYVVLSDQELGLGFSEIQFETVMFQKNEFYCVDGFGKDGRRCLVILPPVMRKTQPFNGLKQSVLILPQDFDCSQFMPASAEVGEDLAQELKTYNSPKQITAPKAYEESQESRPFFSQRSEQREACDECRIKPHQKQPRKGMLQEMRDTLKQLNEQTINMIKQQRYSQHMKDDLKKSMQQTMVLSRVNGGSSWQRAQSKGNKENNLNQSQNNSSFQGLTIQQLIKKIQVDGSKPLIKKTNQDQKFLKSFCQSQQITERHRARAQSNEGKATQDPSLSPFKVYKL